LRVKEGEQGSLLNVLRSSACHGELRAGRFCLVIGCRLVDGLRARISSLRDPDQPR